MDGKEQQPAHTRWVSRVALALVAGAAVMGWGASFVGLHAYGQDQMVGFDTHTAWLVPGTFDGAAFGATLITYRASIYGRSALRGRLLMWTFTGISSWINWIHQAGLESRIVAAGLPIAAVAVFDVVLAEMRADFEERHGQRRFRMRPALLTLRWLVDRGGTAAAFRQRVTGIPVEAIAGIGIERHAASAVPAEPDEQPAPPAAAAPLDWANLPQAPSPEPEPEGLNVPGRHATEQDFAGQPAASAQPGGMVGNAVPSVPESPAERTDELPAVTNPPAIDARERARELVRQDPDAWSGAAIAARFDMSERWGRMQLAAVRTELHQEPERERFRGLVRQHQAALAGGDRSGPEQLHAAASNG